MKIAGIYSLNGGTKYVQKHFASELAEQMSRGISYFEQFVWNLEQRGVADIDVPVMIVGIVG